MLIITNHLYDINELKIMLGKEFDIKDLGTYKKIICMEIYRDMSARKLWLFQKIYVEKVLDKFGMSNLKDLSTPLENHFKISLD